MAAIILGNCYFTIDRWVFRVTIPVVSSTVCGSYSAGGNLNNAFLNPRGFWRQTIMLIEKFILPLKEPGIAISGDLIELNSIQQKGGKKVFAWAMQGNLDPSHIQSNVFELEWPYKSGKIQTFPEIDRASWFDMQQSLEKINPAQQSLVLETASILHQAL